MKIELPTINLQVFVCLIAILINELSNIADFTKIKITDNFAQIQKLSCFFFTT